MPIFCLGLNHKTAPVEIRERLAFSQKHLPENLLKILGLEGVEEAAVLSTCNRVEVYGASPVSPAAMERVRHFLIDHFGIDRSLVEFYRLQGEAAAWHLFEVASGLDSMVLGETEIFGQVKNAYAVAQTTGTTGKRLNRLFQQAFNIGKLVRSNSRIQHGSTSIGAVAVDLAEKIFGDLSGSQVMIIGAGDMSRTTAQSMVSRGAKGIIVSNRSFDKAEELAGLLSGRAMRFDDWESALPEVDILISSTSAPHAVVKKEAIERNMKIRRGRPLYLIDIAVPRDIEVGAGDIDNVFLFDIDQLTLIAEEGKVQREKQIQFCRELIANHLAEKGIKALITESGPHQEARDGAPILP